MALFELKVKQDDLGRLAEEYWEQASEKERQLEREAYEAGAAIRSGDLALINLETIVRWKSERIIHYIIGNSEKKIREVLVIVADPATPLRGAVDALTSLRGIDITIATVILSAIHPDRYAVLDYRALDALGHDRHNVDFYQKYLEYLTALSAQIQVPEQKELPGPTSLHALERGLWQWSRHRNDLQK